MRGYEENVRDIVRLIVQFRSDMLAKGLPMPPLKAILDCFKEYMTEEGFSINDEVFDRLHEEFELYDVPCECSP